MSGTICAELLKKLVPELPRHQLPVRLDEQLYRMRGHPAVDALHNRVAGRELAILIGKEAP